MKLFNSLFKVRRRPEKIKKLVNAAISPTATKKFLQEFYSYGKQKGFFSDKPADLEVEELGKWMGENKTISDKELLREIMEWIQAYNSTKLFAVYQPQNIMLKLPSKTLAAFWRSGHGDCVALSTALGEMAAEIGFKVIYCTAETEELDLKNMAYSEREVIEQQRSGHAYVSINNKQYDPAFNLIDTNHTGREETKEQRAALIWTTHGIVLYKAGRCEYALKAHELAIELNPNYADAWNNKGNVFFGLGKYKEAIMFVEKSLELTPEGHPDRAAMENLLERIRRQQHSEMKR